MAAPAFVSGTGQTGNTTTTGTITLPTTAAGNVLILLFVNGGANAAPTLGGTYNGSAFALIDSGGGGTFASGWGGVYWSRCTANHSGQTVTWTGATDSSAALVIRVSGCITTGNPYDTNISGASVAAANGSLTGFNTTVVDTLVCFCAMTDDNQVKSGFTKNAVAMSNLTLSTSSGGADSGVGYANLGQAGTGATGNFALTEAAGTASGKRLSAFALKPPVITEGEGSAVGGSTAQADSKILLPTVAGATGLSTAQADGENIGSSSTIVEADGNAAGVATDSVVGRAIFVGVGQAQGTTGGTVAGAGIWDSVGQVTGVSVATGAGAAFNLAQAQAAGVATVLGEIENIGTEPTVLEADGNATGTSQCLSVSGAWAIVVATAQGTVAVSGVGENAAVPVPAPVVAPKYVVYLMKASDGRMVRYRALRTVTVN